MTPMSLGLFIKKLQPKVASRGYDILFAYIVVEAKSITFCNIDEKHIIHFLDFPVVFLFENSQALPKHQN